MIWVHRFFKIKNGGLFFILDMQSKSQGEKSVLAAKIESKV